MAEITTSQRDRNDPRPEAEKTTLDKMSAGGDRAKELGKHAERRGKDLDSFLDEARRLAQRTGGRKDELHLTSETKSPEQKTSSNQETKHSLDKAQHSLRITETVRTLTEPGKDSEFDAMRRKVAGGAFHGQQEALGIQGQLKASIFALTSPLPPPGVIYVDWANSLDQREQITRDLRASLSRVTDSDMEAGAAGASATHLSKKGPLHEVSHRKKTA